MTATSIPKEKESLAKEHEPWENCSGARNGSAGLSTFGSSGAQSHEATSELVSVVLLWVRAILYSKPDSFQKPCLFSITFSGITFLWIIFASLCRNVNASRIYKKLLEYVQEIFATSCSKRIAKSWRNDKLKIEQLTIINCKSESSQFEFCSRCSEMLRNVHLYP